jgi:hypothetical protein
MKHRLPRIFSNVHADVEARRLMIKARYLDFHLMQKCINASSG